MKNLLRRCTIAITILSIAAISYGSNQTLPKSWKTLGSNSLNDSWRQEDSSKFTIVTGDFNGDGIIVEARLVIAKDGTTLGIVVFLSQKAQKAKMYLIKTRFTKDQIRAIGIRKVKPGKYKTACGKGYWNCKKNEPSEITIYNDSIDCFKYESANSYYYYDNKSESFKRIWISD